MIEAPQSQDAWPVSTEAPPPALSKTGMMIAAYRAARLSQRLTQRPVPGPQASPAFPAPADSVAAPAAVAMASAEPPLEADPEPDTDGRGAVMGREGHDTQKTCGQPEQSLAPRREPILSDIGLGPSMLIRLNQLGLRDVSDVAQASADDLRAALGDSSRLLNVEAWIASARTLAGTGAAR